ncbi:MAG: hypothetical protein RR766_08730 [Longicatena sp.]
MAEIFKGVFPVYDIEFLIGTKGSKSIESDFKTIADLESLGISIEGNVETWTPMTTAGWARALMTGKSFTMELKGKRNVGDVGNDYIFANAFEDGIKCTTKAKVVFPNGDSLEFDCVLSTTNPGTGDSTNVAALEFTLTCDGKPTYTPTTVVGA